jgi:hypothetical protein
MFVRALIEVFSAHPPNQDTFGEPTNAALQHSFDDPFVADDVSFSASCLVMY